MASYVRACAGRCGRSLRFTPHQAAHMADADRFCEACTAARESRESVEAEPEPEPKTKKKGGRKRA